MKRALRHDADGALLDHDGRCAKCGELVAVGDTRIEPGPGFRPTGAEADPVSAALNAAAARADLGVADHAGRLTTS
ncbi:hypothetical protein AB0F91_21330 [Amycolatopsis sp. NPDC023774]|uniref:hypothetical protein n=1 Tax=Amycolatopsis sp. NPDC023774 TaxID=3155015 RepID=UPI00340D074A